MSNTESEISNLLNYPPNFSKFCDCRFNATDLNQPISSLRKLTESNSHFKTQPSFWLTNLHSFVVFKQGINKKPHQQLTMKHFFLATILALCTLAVLAQATITTTLTSTLNDDDSVTLVAYLNNTGSANVTTISSKFSFPGGRTYLQIGFSYASPSHSSVSSDIVSFIHSLLLL